MRFENRQRGFLFSVVLAAVLGAYTMAACSPGDAETPFAPPTADNDSGAQTLQPGPSGFDAGKKGISVDASVMKDVSVKDSPAAVDVVTKDAKPHDASGIDVVTKDVTPIPVTTADGSSPKPGPGPGPTPGPMDAGGFKDVVISDVSVPDVVAKDVTPAPPPTPTTDDSGTPTGVTTCNDLQSPCMGANDCCDPDALCAYVGGLTQTWCCEGSGNACSSDNDCCGSLLCVDGACSSQECAAVQSPCMTSDDCCDSNAECAQVGGLSQNWCCYDEGAACSSDNDCCGELACTDGTCQENASVASSCTSLQEPCASSAECCGTAECSQVGGLTQNWCCESQGSTCSSDDDCCGDLTCTSGICQASSCLPLQTSCSSTAECCGPGAECAQVGGLTETTCCSEEGATCSSDSDCCGQYSCSDGVCSALSCLPLQSPCISDADCCDPGVTCDTVGGLVQPWCCAPTGVACVVDDDCCGDSRCYDGACL